LDFGEAKILQGIWRIMPSPMVTEFLAQSGLDFQMLDCEHGAYDYATLLPDILACENQGCMPWVRVSGTGSMALTTTAARALASRGVRAIVHGVETHRFKQAVAEILSPIRAPR
jgi:hypothetical protein